MADDPPQPAPRAAIPRLTPRRVVLLAFPIVLWLVAAFAFGGALGKSTDDFSTNLRDPLTGTLPGGFRPFAEYDYFWRPAHMVLIHGLQTFFFGHVRAIHLLSALAHGLVAALLFAFLFLRTRRTFVSASCTLLFLALPILHEGIYFTSFISGPIATALWLWLVIATARFVESPPRRPTVHLAALMVIALAIPFFYEQPGAAILALPLLILSASPTKPAVHRARAALGLTFLLGLTQVAMAGALILTAPEARRGSAASLAPPGEWAGRLIDTLAGGLSHLAGTPARQVVHAGFDLGRHTLATTTLWVWLVPLALTGLAWCLANARPLVAPTPDASSPASASRTPRSEVSSNLLLAAFGLAAAVCSLLPVALVSGQSIASRMLYFPAIGLAVALAGLASTLTSVFPARLGRTIAAALAPAVVAVTSLGAITLVGIQQQYQTRSRTDYAIARQLARLVPHPPANTIFVPLRLDAMVTRTGSFFFDRLRPGAFETVWSATALTRQTYHRRDLWAAGWNPWKLPLLDRPTDSGARLNDRFVVWSPFPPDPTGGTRLTWGSVVPFVVEPGRPRDRDGGALAHVRLVRTLVFESEDGSTLAVQPPLVKSLVDAETIARADTMIFRSFTGVESPDLTELPPWHWQTTGETAAAETCRAWPGPGNSRPAVWLHPTGGGGARAAITATIPRSTEARRLILRATITEHDLDRNTASDPVTLTLTAIGGDAIAPSNLTPLAELSIRRARFRLEQTWLPLIATIPPSTAPVTLRLTISPAEGSNPARILDPVWVTPGKLRPLRPGEHP